MPKVYTPFEPRDRASVLRVSVGSPFETEYSEVVDGFGAHKLVEKGKFDRVQYVNAQKDMCNLKLMIERYSLGDTNALNRASCFYADTTKTPQSLQEWSSMKKQLTSLFRQLPKAAQKKFGTAEQFISAYGTDAFNEALGISSGSVQSAAAAPSSAVVPASDPVTTTDTEVIR